jgi:hypothetical protein
MVLLPKHFGFRFETCYPIKISPRYRRKRGQPRRRNGREMQENKSQNSICSSSAPARVIRERRFLILVSMHTLQNTIQETTPRVYRFRLQSAPSILFREDSQHGVLFFRFRPSTSCTNNTETFPVHIGYISLFNSGANCHIYDRHYLDNLI